MMKKYIIAAISASTILVACTTNENSPGVEFMPDMYRSPAIETYVDYGLDPAQGDIDWDDAKLDSMRMIQRARRPVEGTMPYQGIGREEFAMPYPYASALGDYEASAQIMSPLPTTEENVEKGKELYERICQNCHGAEGKGKGPVSKKIKGIPDYTTTLKDLPEGKMYHAIMHGKGVMGSHAGMLDGEERWLVIEYVKHLQRGGEMPEEGENDNLDADASIDADANTTDG
jgi:mono/diheme cytochrome c family protein